MNSRQRRRLRRFSERAWKMCGLIGQKIAGDLEKFTAGLSGITWKPDQKQPSIGERIITGQIEITRDLIEFGVVKD